VSGSIVYDNGTFDPGLARFESTTARSGSASPRAHSCGALDRGTRLIRCGQTTPIDQRSTGEASATIAGGGPFVNAVTVA